MHIVLTTSASCSVIFDLPSDHEALKMLELLRSNGVNVHHRDDDSVLHVAESGYLNTLKELLSYDAINVPDDGLVILSELCKDASAEVIKTVVDSPHYSADGADNEAIKYAYDYSYPEIVLMLSEEPEVK